MGRKKRQVFLGYTHIGAQPHRGGPGSGPAPGGTVINHVAPILEQFRLSAYHAIKIADGAARKTFDAKLSVLASSLEEEIAAVRQALAETQRPPIDMLKDDIAARTLVLQGKTADLEVQLTLANSYYGSTPFGKDYMYHAAVTFDNISKGRVNASKVQEALNASYRGAYTVQLREAEIKMLQAQIEALQQVLAHTEAQLKAETEATARATAEAEAQARAQEEAEAEKEATRASNQYNLALAAGTAPPFLITAAGSVGVLGTEFSLAKAVSTAIQAVRVAGLSTLAGPLGIGIAAWLYPSALGNSELPDNYLFSMSLAELGLELDNVQQAAAIAQGTVELSLRVGSHGESDGRDELFVAATDIPDIPSAVSVLAAHFDAASGQYRVATEDSPPRTLIWTPAVTPPDSSTSSPARPSAPTTLVGPVLEPQEGRLDAFPELADVGFDDYVIIFPADSGLPPLYVMFKSRRYIPGEVSGTGALIDGDLLVNGNEKGQAIPMQVASEMRGRKLRDFGAFRTDFWMLIANNPDFSSQFGRLEIEMMKRGVAPFAPPDERIGGRVKYELHHRERIADGGEVYDVDNIVIISPKFHIKQHRE